MSRAIATTRLLATALLACGASAAVASDWVLVARDAEGATYHTDTRSIKAVGPYKASWTSVQGQRVPSAGQSEKIAHFVYFDCAAKKAAMKIGVAYGPKAAVVRSETVPDDQLVWRPIVAYSIGAGHFARVCASG